MFIKLLVGKPVKSYGKSGCHYRPDPSKCGSLSTGATYSSSTCTETKNCRYIKPNNAVITLDTNGKVISKELLYITTATELLVLTYQQITWMNICLSVYV
jgi:hypothetical protein